LEEKTDGNGLTEEAEARKDAGKDERQLSCPNCLSPLTEKMLFCPQCGVRVHFVDKFRVNSCTSELGHKSENHTIDMSRWKREILKVLPSSCTAYAMIKNEADKLPREEAEIKVLMYIKMIDELAKDWNE
jgi:hypothetical protein